MTTKGDPPDLGLVKGRPSMPRFSRNVLVWNRIGAEDLPPPSRQLDRLINTHLLFIAKEPNVPPLPPFGSPIADAPLLHHAFADMNGTRLHYVTGGDGPAVVLLHGYPYTWEVWKPVLPLLVEAGYTVITPDLRGLGFSDKADAGYDKAKVL